MKPWENEPDFEEFQFKGIDCKIRRNPMTGCLCGYIKIPKGHQLYNLPIRIYEKAFVCHGGITYAKMEDNGFWIGFHCGRAFDYSPKSKTW